MMEFLERIGHVEIKREPVPDPVTGEDIVAGLRDLEVHQGDVVMVHSSLSRFGEVVGGADTVIDALQNVIGPTGLLVMPTFTEHQVGGPLSGGYDPDASPAYTGAIRTSCRGKDALTDSALRS